MTHRWLASVPQWADGSLTRRVTADSASNIPPTLSPISIVSASTFIFVWLCYVFFGLITYFVSLFNRSCCLMTSAVDPSVSRELALDLTFVSVKQQMFLSVFQASLSSCFLLLCAISLIRPFISFSYMFFFGFKYVDCWNSFLPFFISTTFCFETFLRAYLTYPG